MSRIDFGEVFMFKTYLKEVWKPKKDLQIDSNRSNPTVEAKVCLQTYLNMIWDKIEEEYKKNNISKKIR